ncbi:secretin N-terminal domain-containing protein [Fimbriiglobus ruber]|uniref:NolW-like domain-containing protein n=1 Tax=Fimbriiglobus ruber TaxID=1908690 RepID=A0A225D7T3_9BACT|nr:secretin N-terminal domain-containing protein [Fimbriiglobus ruber]OWK34608.1 hypothetical protein FRUB_10579 [Fimbriiglobus ruber]
MNLCAFVAALALAGPVLPDQLSWTESSVHKLRYAAAADAACALTAFAGTKKIPVKIVAEPMSNSVTITGEPAACKQLIDVLSLLDKQPPAVWVRLTFVEMPAGFADEIGLASGAESTWLLKPREARMLAAAVRNDKDRNFLSRPEMMVADNQTGIFQTGDNRCNLTARVTPRIAPNGEPVTLRLETEIKRHVAGKQTSEIQSIYVTETIPHDEMLVTRGMRSRTADGGAKEVFILATVDRITPPAK